MLRRGEGDGWAVTHLRNDVVNSDVLGPRGLSGDGEFIARELAAGVVGFEHEQETTELVAAAVAPVPFGLRRSYPSAELTAFVILSLWRSTGASSVRVHRDGQREAVPSRSPPGTLHWQLDTGEFRDDPVVGPLWYQVRGWSCDPGSWMYNEICGALTAGP